MKVLSKILTVVTLTVIIINSIFPVFASANSKVAESISTKPVSKTIFTQDDYSEESAQNLIRRGRDGSAIVLRRE